MMIKLILGITNNKAQKVEKQRIIEEHQIPSAAIPECKHGPCLLFSNEDGSNKWFSCSVFRSKKRCPFAVTVDRNGALQSYKSERNIASLPIEEYGKVSKKYENLASLGTVAFWWCKCCANYFGTEEHVHKLDGPYYEWKKPFQLLEPLRDDAGEAQYFFSSETTDLLRNVIEAEHFDSILCIGVPTLFEKLRQSNIRTFLLDYDDRLASFYAPSEFARFSMLVCHFYVPISRSYLCEFLRGSQKLLCLCDPPFGVHVSALMRTLTTLREMFCSVSAKKRRSVFNVTLFLPYFVGKHLKEHSLTMVDFMVTYSNHRHFSRPQKSVVRMFTDMPNCSFALPTEKGYHFCESCNRFVAEKNKHCWKMALRIPIATYAGGVFAKRTDIAGNVRLAI
uniref:Zinc finger CCHC domain-containing protein 4 n=1 Tax=Globodera pallida TaxID=36090 RepID=A0A183BNL1_GLOPA